MTERDRSKRLDRITKLLAQATSVAGTPEAEAFTDRAFQLTAATGIDWSGPQDTATVRCDFPVDGDFLDQRIMLLTRIATAMHCAYAYWLFSPTASTVEVYGTQANIVRVRLLYEPLQTRMFRQAMSSPWSPSSGLSLDEHRISWMQGFTLSIRARLRDAEATAAADADRRDGTDIHTRRHVTDAEQAEAEKRRQLPKVRRRTFSPKLGHDALTEGYRAGQSTDVQRRR
ncbi:DUF2786 domain-containing protein [Nocardia terpenica]|uniref:DUF2786 domain-containing protein n=1 Tax=Nocardia terpenica TaxID=455432 RepID=UPI00189608BC|nr:DUF2786 domain-containing protein [Nocardia terpenica]MBF6064720.1 DUF2786 domain-containing protein [Nocardia terpenica]MBF6107235.1 DUF2786 domain-containing protein [Nocardia terpenica]MBF6114992.1 DUF2786 domain-containing protein [Nocardia terpenica]MBF6122098.1 DUF2786 domain-containing protein [Nocardia terpenica]MBF6154481.1 DUF2786 domain-containing protein [Nocardia terpenica]